MKQPTSKLGLPAKLQPAPSWCSPSFWPLDRLCSLSHGAILCLPWNSLSMLVCHCIVPGQRLSHPSKASSAFLHLPPLHTPSWSAGCVHGESCPPTCPKMLPVHGHRHRDSPGDSYQPGGEPHYPPFSFEQPTLVKRGELSQLSTVEIKAWSQLILKKPQPPVYIKAHTEKLLHPCPAAPPPTPLEIQQLETSPTTTCPLTTITQASFSILYTSWNGSKPKTIGRTNVHLSVCLVFRRDEGRAAGR